MMIRGLNKITKTRGLGYLMSTYTQHPGGLEEAERQAIELAAELMLAGLKLFAPIAYGPQLERAMAEMVPHGDHAYLKSHEFWMPICEAFYSRASYGILAMTPGWSKSKGVAMELYAICRKGAPVFLYDPENKHILSLGEAVKLREDDCNALFELAAEIGIPGYFSEFAKIRAEATGAMISHMGTQKIMEELGIEDDGVELI